MEITLKQQMNATNKEGVSTSTFFKSLARTSNRTIMKAFGHRV